MIGLEAGIICNEYSSELQYIHILLGCRLYGTGSLSQLKYPAITHPVFYNLAIHQTPHTTLPNKQMMAVFFPDDHRHIAASEYTDHVIGLNSKRA